MRHEKFEIEYSQYAEIRQNEIGWKQGKTGRVGVYIVYNVVIGNRIKINNRLLIDKSRFSDMVQKLFFFKHWESFYRFNGKQGVNFDRCVSMSVGSISQ